jgi:hypothetical protein
MYICVKNNINEDIKELFERIERVREEDLKVKFRELLFPFLFSLLLYHLIFTLSCNVGRVEK